MRHRYVKVATPGTIDAGRGMAYCDRGWEMADKFEREIEEILAKLDDKLPPADDRSPISLASRRQQKAKSPRPRTPRSNPLSRLTPTTLLFAGAGIMFGGLLLSNVWQPLIWASMSGVVLFVGAFLWSLRKTPRAARGSAPKGVYWRDRYIEYGPPASSGASRIKNWFRRK